MMRTFTQQTEAWRINPPLTLEERRALAWTCFECSYLHVGPSTDMSVGADVFRYCETCAASIGLTDPSRPSRFEWEELAEYPDFRRLGLSDRR